MSKVTSTEALIAKYMSMGPKVGALLSSTETSVKIAWSSSSLSSNMMTFPLSTMGPKSLGLHPLGYFLQLAADLPIPLFVSMILLEDLEQVLWQLCEKWKEGHPWIVVNFELLNPCQQAVGLQIYLLPCQPHLLLTETKWSSQPEDWKS